jgi:hypothetical protein
VGCRGRSTTNVSRLSDEEMKVLMVSVVNNTYRLLSLLADPELHLYVRKSPAKFPVVRMERTEQPENASKGQEGRARLVASQVRQRDPGTIVASTVFCQ